MIAGGREIDKEYFKFNPIPLGKDASTSFFVSISLNKRTYT